MNSFIQIYSTSNDESVQRNRKHFSQWVFFLIISGSMLMAYHAFNNIGEEHYSTDAHSTINDHTPALNDTETPHSTAKATWKLDPKNKNIQIQQNTASPKQTGQGSNQQAPGMFIPATHYQEAQAIVDDLAQSELGEYTLTAEEIGQLFNRLSKLGRASLPAIRQYLQAPEDGVFDAASEEYRAAHHLLRMEFIKTIGQIEGHEADALLLDILEITGNPSEVVQIAVQLERRDPGVYHEQILTSATDSVKLAAESREEIRGNPKLKREVADVASVFELLRTLGDVKMMLSLNKELMTTAASWSVYSKIALAKLPDGQGIDALSDMVVTDKGELAPRNLLALQMLAQESWDYPEAGDALITLVKNHGSKIPTNTWRKIAWALQGNEYELMPLASANTNDTEILPERINIESLNLTYYKNSYDPYDWPREQVEDRLILINKLLAGSASSITPEAVYALQQARDFIKEGS